MFKKVLYPTDFSACAEKALGYIRKLKEAGTEEVVVINVVDERTVAYGLDVEVRFLLELEKEMKGGVEGIRKKLEGEGFKAKAIVRKGIPFREIIKAADEENVSLIIMGSTGKSMLKEILLGSTSENVIRNSGRPVLTVKP